MTRIRLLLCLFAVALLLSACQKAADKGSDKGSDKGAAGEPGGSGASAISGQDADAIGEASPPPPELGEFKIVSVLLGKSLDADGVVQTDSERFGRKDKIYATVLSTGAHQGLRLQAKWLAPDGSTVAETEQPLVPTGATATSFSIANPEGWPEGEYELRIAINGSPMQARKFQVK
jgi:hypothetical protein